MVLKPCAVEPTTERDSTELKEAMESIEASSVVLKPCAAETTDPMEVSSVVIKSCPAKRKAESYPLKEEEEEEKEEEDSDGDIEKGRDGKTKIVERDDILKAPEWDVDSFDGLEYYSSEEGENFSNEMSPVEAEALANYRIIKRQLIESKGFYMDPGRKLFYGFNRIKPMSLDQIALRGRTFREYWEEMVFVCLQKLNQDKECNVEFVEVVRGNYRGGARSKSFITFMAREKPDGPLVEYQAKCMVTLDEKRHPILCRPAPTPKP